MESFHRWQEEDLVDHDVDFLQSHVILSIGKLTVVLNSMWMSSFKLLMCIFVISSFSYLFESF